MKVRLTAGLVRSLFGPRYRLSGDTSAIDRIVSEHITGDDLGRAASMVLSGASWNKVGNRLSLTSHGLRVVKQNTLAQLYRSIGDVVLPMLVDFAELPIERKTWKPDEALSFLGIYEMRQVKAVTEMRIHLPVKPDLADYLLLDGLDNLEKNLSAMQSIRRWYLGSLPMIKALAEKPSNTVKAEMGLTRAAFSFNLRALMRRLGIETQYVHDVWRWPSVMAWRNWACELNGNESKNDIHEEEELFKKAKERVIDCVRKLE